MRVAFRFKTNIFQFPIQLNCLPYCNNGRVIPSSSSSSRWRPSSQFCNVGSVVTLQENIKVILQCIYLNILPPSLIINLKNIARYYLSWCCSCSADVNALRILWLHPYMVSNKQGWMCVSIGLRRVLSILDHPLAPQDLLPTRFPFGSLSPVSIIES